MSLRVLYDGWQLAYQPNSPAALHLLTLLAYAPEEVQAHLALPTSVESSLPEGVVRHSLPTANTERARLVWEQRWLPRLARQCHAAALHLTASAPALFGGTPQILSPTGVEFLVPSRRPVPGGMAARLRDAFMQGGHSRLARILWPEDLSAPPGITVIPLPRLVHPTFLEHVPSPARLTDVQLPETYILYHGPAALADLRRVLAAWNWAVGAVGEYHPLLLASTDQCEQQAAADYIRRAGFEDTVRVLPPLSLASLAALYHGASTVFHPVFDSPWDGSLALALACAKPLVALETPWSDALVGPAGYLLPYGDGEAKGRLLGAALITVIVEESVAESLSQAARARSAGWSAAEQVERYKSTLLNAYHSLAAQQAHRE